MLYKVIKRSVVLLYIGKEFADGIQLMITGKNNVFFSFDSACFFVFLFLCLNKDEFGYEVKDGVFCENVVPHIMYGIIILAGRISCACVNTLAITLIERQEYSLFAVELCCHIDFVQVHSEIDKSACLEQKQP